MKILISRKVDYALRVLVYLSRNNGQVTTTELSKKLHISRPFLAQILNKLSQEGIVAAKKGKSGGVSLKEPGTSLKTVILMFGPGFAFNKCLTKGYHCFLGSKCPIHDLLCKAQHDLINKLGSISIKKLAKKGVK
jgi:Rrf2 family transcriptional regulator, nitric oxide-sensitive transcriptional repressor